MTTAVLKLDEVIVDSAHKTLVRGKMMRLQMKRRVFAVFAVVGCALIMSGVAAAEGIVPIKDGNVAIPRVVLIGSQLPDYGEAALTLAEVDLSRRGGMVLLDRASINKVLEEHHLLTNGFAGLDDAIQLGKLLTVDLFVHVEPLPGQKGLAVSAFETSKGVRLLDEVIAGGNAEALARALTAKAVEARLKWWTTAGESVAIALVGVHNVDLPKGRAALCESLGALLERRLLKSSSVVVVERKRLQSLNLEHDIAEGNSFGKLLSAPVFLELDVSQARQADALQVVVLLTDAKGRDLGRLRVEGAVLADLVNELSEKILSKLKMAAATAPADPRLEAARFFRSARLWKSHGHYDSMLAAAETAYALDPENQVMKVLLIDALYTAANVKLATARPEALACAARGITLMRKPGPVPVFAEPEQAHEFGLLSNANHHFFRGFGRAVGASRAKAPFSEEESVIYARFCQEWLATSPYAPDATRVASGWELLLFANEGNEFNYFPDNETAWRVFVKQVKRWSREGMAKDPPHIPGALLSSLVMVGDPTLQVPAANYPARAELWAFFENQDQAMLRLYGAVGRVVDLARLEPAGTNRTADDGAQALLTRIYEAMGGGKQFVGVDAGQLSKAAVLVIKRRGWCASMTAGHAPDVVDHQLKEVLGLIRSQCSVGIVPDFSDSQYLLLTATSLDLKEVRNKGLVELREILEAAIGVPTVSQEAARQFKTVLKWVGGQLPAKSSAAEASSAMRLEPVELCKSAGGLLGHALLLRDATDAYVISVLKNPSKLILRKWSLETRQSSALGDVTMHGSTGTSTTFLPSTYPYQPATYRVGGVADACWMSNSLAVAVAGEGVFLFDRAAPVVTALHETTSLPVTHALAVAVLNGKLYVGTDDGYLVSCDPQAKTGTVLVASTRQEKKSPFDGGAPVHFSLIMPDPASNRIVFVASVVAAESNLGAALSGKGGIWDYCPETGVFNQLVIIPHRRSDMLWFEKVDTGRFMMQTTCPEQSPKMFDMRSNSLSSVSIVSAGKQGAESIPICPPFARQGDWLWTASPWGRVSINTWKWEPLPPFRMPDGSIQVIRPETGLVPVEAEQVLFATQAQLWLATGTQKVSPLVVDAPAEEVKLIKPGSSFSPATVLSDRDGVYVILDAWAKPNLVMQKWMPASRMAVQMGSVTSRWAMAGFRPSEYRTGGILDACLTSNTVAVTILDEGVFLFDKKTPSVTALHKVTSLPLAHPRAIGALGQTLYVGTEDGYLVSCDLETHRGEVLVASSRREGRSPFDNGPPVSIWSILPDPEHDRIVFMASVVAAEGAFGDAISGNSGAWEYCPKTGQFKQLVSFRHRRSDFFWTAKADAQTLMTYPTWNEKQPVMLNLASNSLDRLMIYPKGASDGGSREQARFRPPFLRQGDWILTAEPWGRISVKTWEWEALPLIRLPDGSDGTLRPDIGMVPVGKDQVMVGIRDRLWLVKPE